MQDKEWTPDQQRTVSRCAASGERGLRLRLQYPSKSNAYGDHDLSLRPSRIRRAARAAAVDDADLGHRTDRALSARVCSLRGLSRGLRILAGAGAIELCRAL